MKVKNPHFQFLWKWKTLCIAPSRLRRPWAPPTDSLSPWSSAKRVLVAGSTGLPSRALAHVGGAAELPSYKRPCCRPQGRGTSILLHWCWFVMRKIEMMAPPSMLLLGMEWNGKPNYMDQDEDLSTEVLRAKKKSVERLSSQILRRMLSWQILKKEENGTRAWPLQFVRRYQKYWQAYKYFPGAFGRYYGTWCLNWKKNIHACYSMIASCRNRLGIGQCKLWLLTNIWYQSSGSFIGLDFDRPLHCSLQFVWGKILQGLISTTRGTFEPKTHAGSHL